jgi:hypothetical protein
MAYILESRQLTLAIASGTVMAAGSLNGTDTLVFVVCAGYFWYRCLTGDHFSYQSREHDVHVNMSAEEEEIRQLVAKNQPR